VGSKSSAWADLGRQMSIAVLKLVQRHRLLTHPAVCTNKHRLNNGPTNDRQQRTLGLRPALCAQGI